MFKHFIITRFNIIQAYSFSNDKNGQSTQTCDWLETRFVLFERCCIPSLANQKCKKFIWFVLFDVSTPEKFKVKINNYEETYPFFKPLFIGQEGFLNVFRYEVLKYLTADDEFIITTRLDNDDSFHEDMILEIQEKFDKQCNTFICYNYGFQWDMNRRVLAPARQENNHFISRIEKLSSGIQSVLSCDHTKINDFGDVLYINNEAKPMWIETIHDRNVYNFMSKNAIPIFKNKYFKSFGLSERISFISSVIIWRHQGWPKYKNKFKLEFVHWGLIFARKTGTHRFLKRIYNSIQKTPVF